jgi:cyclophilin family peptidyl-prolyl cis-trans isomerase/HEAT repeat protein
LVISKWISASHSRNNLDLFSTFSIFTLASLLLLSCLGEKRKNSTSHFSEKQVQEIHTAQLSGDSLFLAYKLNSSNADSILEVLKVAASMQSQNLIPAIIRQITNANDTNLKNLAVFALGQYRNPALTQSLLALSDTVYMSNPSPELIMAIAKSLPAVQNNDLEFPDPIFGIVGHMDDEHTKAYAYALATLARKGYKTDGMLEKLRYFLSFSEIPNRPRIAACMAAGSESWFKKNADYLYEWLRVERNADVKISVLNMIAKTKADKAKQTLLAFACDASLSNSIRIRSIELLKKFACSTTEFQCAAEDREDPIAIAAFNSLSAKATSNTSKWIKNSIAYSSPRRAAFWKYLCRVHYPHSTDSLIHLFNDAVGVYDRIAWADAFSESDVSPDWLINKIDEESNPPVRYALCTALLQVYSKENPQNDGSKKEAVHVLLTTNDIGAMAIAGEIALLMKPTNADLPLIKDITEAIQRLQLPVEVETYLALNKAMKHFGRAEVIRNIRPSYQPDWNKIESLPEYFKAIVKTTKGDFEITFHTADAILSTAALHQWIEDGFYNGKYFHRVVPNFVIQTGCPRGDGMGSGAFTLPSEFSRQHFTKWKVGLASSGNDTESSQWFVTTGEAYWLDGRYTIVGEVSSGFEVIEKIAVGDQILSMEII